MTAEKHLEPAKKWQERWKSVGEGERGGQSSTHFVRFIAGPGDSPLLFLKCLHSQKDMERRRRMHREVAAYQTLTNHIGIPRLIESNAEAFNDLDYKLYLVTELVDGVTLEKFVEQRNGEPVPLSEATACLFALLDIIEYCHSNDVVHRDVKPANILLKGNALSSPVLVDFGLSFESGMDDETAELTQATSLHIELGNRFLRLRELGAQSLQKRDPRSDLACVAGILFYLLTLEAPVHTGTNSLGAFAHQRDSARQMLAKIVDDQTRMRVSRLFDRAFQETIGLRFQSAAELRQAIVDLDSPSELVGEDLIEQVKARLASSERAKEAQLYSQLQACTMAVYSVLKQLADELNMSLYGMEGRTHPDFVSQGYAIVPGGTTPDPEQEIRFTITPVGTEFVFELSGSDRKKIEAARVPISVGMGAVSAELRTRIRGFAIQRVRI